MPSWSTVRKRRGQGEEAPYSGPGPSVGTWATLGLQTPLPHLPVASAAQTGDAREVGKGGMRITYLFINEGPLSFLDLSPSLSVSSAQKKEKAATTDSSPSRPLSPSLQDGSQPPALHPGNVPNAAVTSPRMVLNPPSRRPLTSPRTFYGPAPSLRHREPPPPWSRPAPRCPLTSSRMIPSPSRPPARQSLCQSLLHVYQVSKVKLVSQNS